MFGHVLSFILEKHYHDELKNETYEWITLDTLLDWVAWPNYIKIFQQGKCFYPVEYLYNDACLPLDFLLLYIHCSFHQDIHVLMYLYSSLG